jgi:hypothetical protein
MARDALLDRTAALANVCHRRTCFGNLRQCEIVLNHAGIARRARRFAISLTIISGSAAEIGYVDAHLFAAVRLTPGAHCGAVMTSTQFSREGWNRPPRSRLLAAAGGIPMAITVHEVRVPATHPEFRISRVLEPLKWLIAVAAVGTIIITWVVTLAMLFGWASS